MFGQARIQKEPEEQASTTKTTHNLNVRAHVIGRFGGRSDSRGGELGDGFFEVDFHGRAFGTVGTLLRVLDVIASSWFWFASEAEVLPSAGLESAKSFA